MSRGMRRVSTHRRTVGMLPGAVIECTDTIVTDGRRTWCVTDVDGERVVRPAWGVLPDTNSRPMRRCGLRSRILDAA